MTELQIESDRLQARLSTLTAYGVATYKLPSSDNYFVWFVPLNLTALSELDQVSGMALDHQVTHLQLVAGIDQASNKIPIRNPDARIISDQGLARVFEEVFELHGVYREGATDPLFVYYVPLVAANRSDDGKTPFTIEASSPEVRREEPSHKLKLGATNGPMTVKAIETTYKGYRFRSRLEARWAVFLDSFNEEWQYEVEGFELPSGRYLPDFWLPRLHCWLEIKGVEPTSGETDRCYDLAHATDKPVAMAWGLPYAAQEYEGWRGKHAAERLKVHCFDATDGSAGNNWWDEAFWAIDKNGLLCLCSNNSIGSREFRTPSTQVCWYGMKQLWDIQSAIDEVHVNKAKSARFEFQR